jgi:hypothetical protein
MARTVARLPAGSRITDHISLGVIAKTFPLSKVHSVLVATGTASVRQRNLPSHVIAVEDRAGQHRVSTRATHLVRVTFCKWRGWSTSVPRRFASRMHIS